MDRVVVNPDLIRGLGNVVEVDKTVSDFRVDASTVSSGSETVDNLSHRVFELDYKPRSVLVLESGDSFVDYTSGLTGFSVSVVLETGAGVAIGSSTVSCTVNNDTTLTSTTDGSGVAGFTVPITSNISDYVLEFQYAGSVVYSGTVLYHRVFVGGITGLVLTSDPEVTSLNENTHLISTLTGTDITGEVRGVPNQIVDVFEEYTPGVTVKCDSSVISNGEDTTITAQIIDLTDGSKVSYPGQTIKVYEEYTPGVKVSSPTRVIQSGDSVVLTCQLIDEDDGSLVRQGGRSISLYDQYVPMLTLSSSPGVIGSGDTAVITATLSDEDGSAVPDETVEVYQEFDELFYVTTSYSSYSSKYWQFTVHVYNQFGEDKSGVKVRYRRKQGTTTYWGQGTTDSSGVVTRTILKSNWTYAEILLPDIYGDNVLDTIVFEDAPYTPVVTTLTLFAEPTTIYSGETVEFTVVVKDQNGNTMGGQDVHISGGGVIGTGTTNQYGICDFVKSNLSVGTHTVTAESNRATGNIQSNSVTVTVLAVPVATTLSVTGSKSVLSQADNEYCTLTATVLDQNSSPMSGASVVFKKGSTTLDTVTTNASGIASYDYYAAGSGDVTLTVQCSSLSDTYSIEDCLAVNPLTDDPGWITFASGTTKSFDSTNGLTIKSSSDAESMIGVTAVNNMEASAKVKWGASSGALLSLHNSWVYRESTSKMSIIDMTNVSVAWSGRTQLLSLIHI